VASTGWSAPVARVCLVRHGDRTPLVNPEMGGAKERAELDRWAQRAMPRQWEGDAMFEVEPASGAGDIDVGKYPLQALTRRGIDQATAAGARTRAEVPEGVSSTVRAMCSNFHRTKSSARAWLRGYGVAPRSVTVRVLDRESCPLAAFEASTGLDDFSRHLFREHPVTQRAEMTLAPVRASLLRRVPYFAQQNRQPGAQSDPTTQSFLWIRAADIWWARHAHGDLWDDAEAEQATAGAVEFIRWRLGLLYASDVGLRLAAGPLMMQLRDWLADSVGSAGDRVRTHTCTLALGHDVSILPVLHVLARAHGEDAWPLERSWQVEAWERDNLAAFSALREVQGAGWTLSTRCDAVDVANRWAPRIPWPGYASSLTLDLVPRHDGPERWDIDDSVLAATRSAPEEAPVPGPLQSVVARAPLQRLAAAKGAAPPPPGRDDDSLGDRWDVLWHWQNPNAIPSAHSGVGGRMSWRAFVHLAHATACLGARAAPIDSVLRHP
jgi:hypothetical protein